MASEAALKYAVNRNYGAVGAEQYEEARVIPSAIPVAQPSAEVIEKARERRALLENQRYSISLFGILGTVTAAVFALFVILAHISYTEITNETVRLKTRMDELVEQERRLEIEYERVFDLNEVEEYATSVLGMTKPDSDQVVQANTAPRDKTEIIAVEETGNPLKKLGSYLSSLLEYFT